MKAKHPHGNLGKWLHPAGGKSMAPAVAMQKAKHPEPTQVMTPAKAKPTHKRKP